MGRFYNHSQPLVASFHSPSPGVEEEGLCGSEQAVLYRYSDLTMIPLSTGAVPCSELIWTMAERGYKQVVPLGDNV